MAITGIMKKILLLLPLIAAVLFALFLTLPTISNNIGDPHMIVYFNADEGGLMDEIWYYYSGNYNDSYQWDFDYGLEMVYLADIARLGFSRFVEFTPGMFVLILRWFHLIAWILALVALWRLVNRHFGGGWWRPASAVLLLATRPAFAYFTVNTKPEPLVLLFMILGMDYALRIIDKPAWRNLLAAVACAVLAFLVKFAGLFLLPAIAASVYLSERYGSKYLGEKRVFPKFKIAWILPSLVGSAILALLAAVIVFYVRKSTGFTWYQQFGFWDSLHRTNMGIYLFWGGILLILISGLLWIAGKAKNPPFKKLTGRIIEVNSISFLVAVVFAAFLLVFGVRWLITPKHFLLIYSQLFPIASGTDSIGALSRNGFFQVMFNNIITAFRELDPVLSVLFIFYLVLEISGFRKNLESNTARLLKRMVLLFFLLPFFAVILSMLRMTHNHMLPFFAAVSLLVIEGMGMVPGFFGKTGYMGIFVPAAIAVCLVVDIGYSGLATAKTRLYQFRQKEDIVYELKAWFEENIPKDAAIVSDHYISVYIPEGYTNVSVFKGFLSGWADRFRELVDTRRPRFVYYDAGDNESAHQEPIESILPGRKAKLVRSFESKGRNYERREGMKFVIYEMSY